MKFRITGNDKTSKARTAELETPHGTVQTPVFMPVGTAGCVKAVHRREAENDIGARIILGNTYHLYLRPGTEVLEKAGGIHRFSGWTKALLTDSGGYQVYSLADKRKITEEGVRFTSHIDGSAHTFTPENVIDIQRSIGADIVMAFDECTPYPCGEEYAKKSMELTHRWLKRCADRMKSTEPKYGYDQSLFPIVQGSTYPHLRAQSAEAVLEFETEGYAIGGLSVGEPAEIMYSVTEKVCGILPESKPRYLMGVGTPANLLECIALGVDLFDCVMPTRNARNGMLFTRNGILNIRNEKWKTDFSALDPDGTSFASLDYSKAYLRHLSISKEILAAQIASVHNLAFYAWLMEESGKKIREGVFNEWKNEMVPRLSARL